MTPAATVRAQIEAALAARIPAALTPAPRFAPTLLSTGDPSIDEILGGGFPSGAITEMAGPECSGRTSLAFSCLARITRAGKVCAWVDVSNAFHPESAAASGMDLSRTLWVRCGGGTQGCKPHRSRAKLALPQEYFVPAPVKKGLHGGGMGAHPRTEIRGLSKAVGRFLKQEPGFAPCLEPECANPYCKESACAKTGELSWQTEPIQAPATSAPPGKSRRPTDSQRPWSRIDQALRVTDQLLQGGGFGAIVLDMGGVAPEDSARVPLATWFRFRVAAEQAQTCLLLLTQRACAKNSAAVTLQFESADVLQQETVLAGLEQRVEVTRQRFAPSVENPMPFRKPPQRELQALWRSRTAWTGRR